LADLVPGKPDRRRVSRLALAAAVIVAVTGGAVFGAIRISSSVARTAIELHTVDDAARAATVVRSHLAIAQGASPQQKAVSIDEAADSLDVLERSLSGFPAGEAGSLAVTEVTRFVDLAKADLAVVGFTSIDEVELNRLFQSSMAAIGSVQDELASSLTDFNTSYRVVGIVLGLVIAGLAPLVFFFWARVVSRRTMEVRELSLKLQHEEALKEARGEILRTVVHEFRTPLTGIVGLAEILQSEGIRASGEGAEMVSMIRVEAEDMTQLTDDVLVSEGLKVGRFEVSLGAVEVGGVIDQVVHTFELRDIEIGAEWDAGVVLADERRLRQVVRNLVSNAVKYGGPDITVSGRNTGEHYELVVADDGDGVPEAILDRLFTPYPHLGTGTASNQSVGLGLAIVSELAEAMGGSIDHERAEGRTLFKLQLETAPEGPTQPAVETIASGARS
jgi:signal transduction histidine kinase